MNEPLARALEDVLEPEYPRTPQPGDPGTRTISLHARSGSLVGRAAIDYHSDPDVVLMGQRVFVSLPTWRGGDGSVWVEKVAVGVQVVV